MREYKLKSKNNYELYYSRKIGKSSYMGMEQVCEENCHSLQGNRLSLFGLGLSPDRSCLFGNCAGYDPVLFCILENIIHRLYMNKGIKKTDNYFERVKQRANQTNYRYYFFDYLYFKGEVWGKKIGRMSGFILLFWYWWWIVVLPGNFLLINSVPQWSSLHLGYLGAMFLLIFVFILARYRKARVQALLNHYRRSKHVSTIQACFLYLLPFVLFFLETWLFDEWGWTDCVRWNE